MQVAISILRLLLFVARPKTSALGIIPNSMIYRSVDQYPVATSIPGILILQIDAPMYFANTNYLRERYIAYIWKKTWKVHNIKSKNAHTLKPTCISMLFFYFPLIESLFNLDFMGFRISRWIDEEEDRLKESMGESSLQYIIIDMTGKWLFATHPKVYYLMGPRGFSPLIFHYQPLLSKALFENPMNWVIITIATIVKKIKDRETTKDWTGKDPSPWKSLGHPLLTAGPSN